jgi:hypothetical protein
MPFKILFTPSARGELHSFRKNMQVHIIFVLAKVDDFGREIKLARQNDKLMAYLNERARERATIPLDDIKKELRLYSTKLRPKKESPLW